MTTTIFNARIWRSGKVDESARIYNWLKFDAARGKITDCGIGTPENNDNNGSKVDLGGKWVFPGFHDGHAHVEMQGRFSNEITDFSTCNSIKSFKEKLKILVDESRKNPQQNNWIVGFGWCQELLEELPNRELLDDVCESLPVFLYRWDLHVAVVNTKALEICGITKDTECPQGGGIDYFPPTHSKAGEPTGFLRELAIDLAKKYINISSGERKKNILRGQNQCIKNGITSIHCCDENCWNEYVALAKNDELIIPSYSANWYIHFKGEVLNHPKYHGERHGDKLVSTAVKIFVDGSLGSQTAALSIPYKKEYTNNKDNYGILYHTQDELNEMVKFADENGYQLEIHAIGDRAMDYALTALEVNNLSAKKRPIIVHCQIMRQEQIARMRNVGAIASIQSQFTFTDSPWVLKILPDELRKLIYPHRTLKKGGIHLAGSTDMPCNKPTPLMALYDAIYQTDKIRDPKNPSFLPHECLTFSESMDLLTIDSAYLDFAENEIGKLEPGYLANFIVLNVPRNAEGQIGDVSKDPGLLLDTCVAETWVKGIKKYDLNSETI